MTVGRPADTTGSPIDEFADEERIALVERGELPGSMASAQELGLVPESEDAEDCQSAFSNGPNTVQFELYDLDPYDMAQLQTEVRELLTKWAATGVAVNGIAWSLQ